MPHSLPETAPLPSLSPGRLLERILRVVEIRGGIAWAVPEAAGGCSSCASASRCGSAGVAARLALDAATLPSPSVGDRIVVGIEDGAVTEAAVTAYLIPMLAMMLAAGIAGAWSHSDQVAALAAAAGLALGVLAARLRARRPAVRNRLVPRFLRHADMSARCRHDRIRTAAGRRRAGQQRGPGEVPRPVPVHGRLQERRQRRSAWAWPRPSSSPWPAPPAGCCENWLLAPFGLGYLRILTFILVIAAAVQFTEMVIKKIEPRRSTRRSASTCR